jgi:aryl-alcohol dehydrogenase-like predicted oxidoreductase
MQTKLLGRTGLKVSALCFGTMPFGTDTDETTSARLFHRCREAGIDTFDCADVYGNGRAEEILGQLVGSCRGEVVLTSKCYFPTGRGPNARGASRYHIRSAVEASLRRLGTDRIDLYYLHRFDDLTPLEESLRALDDLVAQGKVLYPAVSNFAAWQAQKALGLAALHGWAPIACVQPMYNLVKRQAEVEILPMAAAEGLGAFPYSPLGGGLFSGKYGRETRPASGRLLENKMYQTRYGDPAYYEVAERFARFAREGGWSPAALAVAWVASHPAVTAPILGARSLEQLEEALGAAQIQMTPELRRQISELSPEPPPATDRNEERSEHNYGTR